MNDYNLFLRLIKLFSFFQNKKHTNAYSQIHLTTFITDKNLLCVRACIMCAHAMTSVQTKELLVTHGYHGCISSCQIWQQSLYLESYLVGPQILLKFNHFLCTFCAWVAHEIVQPVLRYLTDFLPFTPCLAAFT